MNTHSNCAYCHNTMKEWECEFLRAGNSYSPTKNVITGEFRIGVSPDNLNEERKFRYKSAAKREARRFTEITGIQFYVYEQVTTFKPVS